MYHQNHTYLQLTVINFVHYAGPLANNSKRSCSRNIDNSEGTNCFCRSWHIVKQLNKIWSGSPINILFLWVLHLPPPSLFSYLVIQNCANIFIICCKLPHYFVECLTTLYYRSMLWVGPALIFSSATAISMLGWDNKVRSILSTSFPHSGKIHTIQFFLYDQPKFFVIPPFLLECYRSVVFFFFLSLLNKTICPLYLQYYLGHWTTVCCL